MRAEIPFGQREFFLKSSRPSFLIKRAALGNLKASFHCTHWHRFFPLNKAFSKTYPSVLTLKEGCSKIIPSFFVDKASCTRQFESEFSLHSLASLFPIKEGSTSHLGLIPSGKKRETALRCSEPLRSKVGGASKVFAMVVRDGTALLKVETACVGLTTACYNGIM